MTTSGTPEDPVFGVYVAKLDAARKHVFSHQFTALDAASKPAQIMLRGAGVDAAGHTHICGSTLGTVNFGGVALTPTAGTFATFVAEFDASGKHVRSRIITASTASAVSCAVKADGSLAMTGIFITSIDAGGGHTLSGTGGFLLLLDPLQNAVFLNSLPMDSDQYGAPVAFDAAGNVIVAAYSSIDVTFGAKVAKHAGGVICWSRSTAAPVQCSAEPCMVTPRISLPSRSPSTAPATSSWAACSVAA